MPHANRLFGLVIDEISGVDKDANGHAQVVIAKRDRGEDEGPMAFFDIETGQELTEDELENGDHVRDESGAEYWILDDETMDTLDDDQLTQMGIAIPDDASSLEDEYDDSGLQLVGKADGNAAITGGLSTVYETGRRKGTKRLGQGMTTMPRRAGRVRNVNAGGGHMVGKRNRAGSMGDSIMETLSKALGEDERFEAVSKAFNALEARTRAAEVRAARSERLSKSLEDQAILQQYVALADEYGLPVDSEEFGQVLMELGENPNISKRSLELLDNVFAAAADGLAYGGMTEIGAAGGGRAQSSVMDMIEASAAEHVGKADVTMEQTTTALFDAHPELYDEYLRENQGR